MSGVSLDERWERYCFWVGQIPAMPREVFDLIAANRPNLTSDDLHRLWLTKPSAPATPEGEPQDRDGHTCPCPHPVGHPACGCGSPEGEQP